MKIRIAVNPPQRADLKSVPLAEGIPGTLLAAPVERQTLKSDYLLRLEQNSSRVPSGKVLLKSVK